MGRYLSRDALLEAELSLDLSVMVLGVVAAVGISALAEAYSVWLMFSTDTATSMSRDLAASRHGAPRRVIRGAIVCVQAAAATLFAMIAFNATIDLWRASRVTHGFAPDDLWCIDVKTASGVEGGPGPSQGQQFIEALDALRMLPGVTSAGATNSLPLTLEPGSIPLAVRDVVLPSNERAELEIATPGYFETLRQPLLEGRTFSKADDRKHPLVAMVNAAFRRRHWPGQASIGREVGIVGSPWFRVIGVVGDVLSPVAAEPTRPKLYLCSLQATSSGEATFVVRTNPGLSLEGRSVSGAIRAVNRSLAVAPARPISAVLADLRKPHLFAASCLSVLAFVATALAFAGSFGAVSARVARRKREMAIRRALGARETALVLRIVVESATPIGVGIVAGLWAATQALRFYGTVVGLRGGGTALSAAVASVSVAILLCSAAFLPAWRAVARPLAGTLRTE